MHPKHTILLVEDEKEPADMLANFLEMEDYEKIGKHICRFFFIFN